MNKNKKDFMFDMDEEHCKRLGELREKMEHAREFLQDSVNDYESYLADMEIDVDLY